MEGTTAYCARPGDRADERRRRIIDAARMLFVNNGFHATGVAQIARESGVAVGQIYRDFDAKETIVAAIVEGDCAVFMARESLHRAIAAGDSDAVWAWLRQLIDPGEASGTEALFAEIVAEAARNERIAAIFARTQLEVGATTRAAIALLAPGDHIAERRDLLAELVLSQSLGLMQQRLLRPGFEAGALVDMFMSGVAREISALNALVVPDLAPAAA